MVVTVGRLAGAVPPMWCRRRAAHVALRQRPAVRLPRRSLASSGKQPTTPHSVVAATGAVVGVFAAHTGLAGSIIALPTLHSFTGMASHVVTGTVLAATTGSAAAAAAAYAWHGVADASSVMVLGGSGVLTAAVASQLTKSASTGALKKVTGVVLLLICPVLWLGGRRRDRSDEAAAAVAAAGAGAPAEAAAAVASAPGSSLQAAREKLPFLLAGAVAGFSQGFIGVGGGIVMTTLMTVGTELPQHTIIATALSATLFINTSATIVHYRLGHVNVRAAALMAGVSAVTAVGATQLAMELDDSVLRKYLAVAVGASALVMLK